MIITKRLKGKAIATWLGPTGEAARRAVEKVRQRVTSAPQRLDFYFDIGDGWSYLAAQIVDRLSRAYPVELGVHVTTPPASDVDPAPLLRKIHSVRDAILLAQYWDVDFPGKKEADSGLIRDVGTALARDRPARDQLRAILELGHAMWEIDRKKVAALLGVWGTESHGSVPPILNSRYAELRKAGHYQGAMIHYAGEWYGAVDRLPYLEAALARDLGVPVANVLSPRPIEARGSLPLVSKGDLTCEVWFSFRSPYSYLALEQIEGVLAPFGVPLVLRPVAPLVNRGAVMPGVKRMYIVLDAKREADRLGIPFGEICDPLGKGIDNCLTVAGLAQKQGKALAFARSAMRGIWTEARDMAEYVDLKFVVERAGLVWEDAQAAIGDAVALKQAQVNASDLAVYGLWGVPSFRVGDLVTWGQDRLPLIADRLRRNQLAPPAVPAPEPA